MKHILIVEDDAQNNQILREYLEEHDYVCSQAFSGSEAKLLFSIQEFDLILLDLMLPGIPGEELVSLFSEKTPVIVLSAKSGLDSKVEALSSGADDYLCKPFQLPELLVRIQVQLRRKEKAVQSGCLEDNVYRHKEWILNPDTQELTAAGAHISLTKHEFLILELLIRNPKRVFSKQTILGGGISGGGQDSQRAYQQHPLQAQGQRNRFLYSDSMGYGLQALLNL